METNSKNHAIMLPLHLQGHINPFTQLSLNLASKGFTITFLTFQHTHQKITQASNSHSTNLFNTVNSSSKHDFDVRYRVISDGLPIEYDRDGNLEKYLEWYLHGGLYDQLVKEIGTIILECSKPKVNVLIFDTFYPWASKIGKKCGICCGSFWTEPALVFNIYYHVHLLRQYGHLDCLGDTRKDPIDYIPGINSIEPKDLMSFLQDKDTSTFMHKLIFEAFQDIRSIDFIFCNTVQELEPDVISTLQTLLPFYPIGPILLSEPTRNEVPTSFWAESNCSDWLESKTYGSVLYVSFGSLACLTKNDVMEIAYGLMESNIDFIWVLRPRTVLNETNDLLPVGFEDNVRGRGIIIPWTDQITVLSNEAIGGFLTHCGRNSVLESIWYEVPMLCFPVFTDQFTNRKLVVDDWKVGVNLVDDWKVGVNLCNGSTIQRGEIATQIKGFMSQGTKKDLRKNISDKRHILQNALERGGSSEKYIDQFLELVSNK